MQEPAVRFQLHLQHDCLSSRDLQKLAVGMQVVFVPKDDTKRKREETAAAAPAEVTPTSTACVFILLRLPLSMQASVCCTHSPRTQIYSA